jgi:hypothetical protein
MTAYREPAERPPVRRAYIDWREEEVSYDHRVQRAHRVYDHEGQLILDLSVGQMGLSVAQWEIVRGGIGEAGRIDVEVSCAS